MSQTQTPTDHSPESRIEPPADRENLKRQLESKDSTINVIERPVGLWIEKDPTKADCPTGKMLLGHGWIINKVLDNGTIFQAIPVTAVDGFEVSGE